MIFISTFRSDQLHQEWEEKQDDWRCDAQHREAERQKSTRRRNTAMEFQDHHLKQVKYIMSRVETVTILIFRSMLVLLDQEKSTNWTLHVIKQSIS